MKNNTRFSDHFKIKPLKIDLSEAEILADLQYGVSGKASRQATPQRESKAS